MSGEIDKLIEKLKELSKLAGVVHFCVDCMEHFHIPPGYVPEKMVEEEANWEDKHEGHLVLHANVDEDEIYTFMKALEWVKRQMQTSEVEKVVFAGLDESCWIEMTCPECGEKIIEWVSEFEQTFKCPKCGQKYTYILDFKVVKGGKKGT